MPEQVEGCALGRIWFTSNLERHLSCPTVEARGRTVRQVLDAVFAENPRLKAYLLDDQDCLRRHVNIFIGDRPVEDRTGLGDPVAPDEDVHVFQALSGG